VPDDAAISRDGDGPYAAKILAIHTLRGVEVVHLASSTCGGGKLVVGVVSVWGEGLGVALPGRVVVRGRG